MNKISLLILAGGLGSRYQGQKQIDSISKQKESLMEFALYDAVKSGIQKFVFIINNQFPEEYKNHLIDILKKKNCSAYFVEQTLTKYIPEKYQEKLAKRKKPLGTAHAVLCAKDIIQEPFITMNADDFYARKSFEIAVKAIKENKINQENFAMLAFKLKNTLSKNGSVSRGICQLENEKLIAVEEFTKIEKNKNQLKGLNEKLEKQILKENTPVSMNFWILHPSFFALAEKEMISFLEKNKEIISKEFYLPGVIDQSLKENKIKVNVLPTSAQWFGLTYKEDKTFVEEKIAKMKAEKIYPEKLWE